MLLRILSRYNLSTRAVATNPRRAGAVTVGCSDIGDAGDQGEEAGAKGAVVVLDPR
jgi:hypothetical protein